VALTRRALNEVPIGVDPRGNTTYAENIYEWHEGNVYLISDGRDRSVTGRFGESSVRLLGTDASGADVFFTTADSLVPQDTDSELDFYDARIGGGFPSPAPVAGCTGEGCRGAPAGAPVFSAPGSAVFSGAGNLPPTEVKPTVKPKQKPKPKKARKPKRKKRGRKAAKTGRHIKRGRK